MIPDLSKYDNSWYNPGAGKLKRLLWYFTNLMVLKNPYNPSSVIKKIVLKIFGAKVGEGVVIKPGVNIKYPWRLTIGNYSWIGENVWIDNLADVTVGDNCCVSQGAMLLCGNHNYKKSTFDLIIGQIILESGSWVGAQSVVCPGVTFHEGAILTVGSVATKDLDSNTIYQGIPAHPIRMRI